MTSHNYNNHHHHHHHHHQRHLSASSSSANSSRDTVFKMNMSTTPALSVKEIVEKASIFDYQPLVPLKYWLRTAENLVKEANIYMREGNDQQAYFLLYRHVNLVLKYLDSHPEARLPENRAALAGLQRRVPSVLERLEVLKPQIEKRYDAYRAAVQQRKQLQRQQDYEYQQQQELLFHQQRQNRTHAQSSRSRASSIASSTDSSAGSHNAQHRRDWSGSGDGIESYSTSGEQQRPRVRHSHSSSDNSFSRQSLPPSLIPGKSSEASSQVGQRHFEQHGWSYEPAGTSKSESSSHGSRSPRKSRDEGEIFDLQKSIQSLQVHTKSPLPPSLQRDLQEKVESRNTSSYSLENGTWQAKYPTIPKRGSWQNPSPAAMPDEGDFAIQKLDRLPTIPPKIRQPSTSAESRSSSTLHPYENSVAPARPAKVNSRPPQPELPPKLSRDSDKRQNSSLSTYEFNTVAFTEGGSPLRTIFIPETLRSKFLAIAAPNTRANLETCGILCGFLKQNALFVNRLVIPDQEATSDTCATTDEAALFNYVDSEDLMVLGWIHTHPTQTCFMSSVDLHTHCSYQLMLPESIAIVCAPRQQPSWGVFRLTDPPGIKAITKCRNSSLFHPHEESNIYTDALRPGHVCEVKEMGFGVVDLRKKR